MILKLLKLKFFGLIKEATIIPGQINIITGENRDVNPFTGNSIGKSTLENAITFLIWGEVTGQNLADLISFGCVYSQIEGEIDNLKIIRKIPNSLEIIENGVTLEFNTPTIAQEYLIKRYGTLEQFKKYRCMDISKGINLLDKCADSRAVVTLRKELMSFIDDMFSSMRQKLLDKKSDRETYSVDKRLYKFSLSDKRLKNLDNGVKQLTINLNESKKDVINQTNLVNQVKNDISVISNSIEEEHELIKKYKITASNNETTGLDYESKIEELKKQPLKVLPQIIDYDKLLKSSEEKLSKLNAYYDATKEDIENKSKDNDKLVQEKIKLNTEIQLIEKEMVVINNEIENIKILNTNIRCDKCYSPITEENKTLHLNEKNIAFRNKALEKEKYLKNLAIISKQCDDSDIIIDNAKGILLDTESKISQEQNNIQNINAKKFNQEKELNEINNQQIIKESEISKYNALIKSYIDQNEKINVEIDKIDNALLQQVKQIEDLNFKLKTEEDALNYMNTIVEAIEKKLKLTESFLLKLREAFKFSEYKYTAKDVMLYTESIKVLDSFASSYVQDWLTQLSIIMNDLLKPLNMEISFVDSKEFIKIKELNRPLKYTQLSSGQRTFLGVIFKLSILLQRGQTDGIILIDEGINNLHDVNFSNLIEVLKGLNFQPWIIYQNVKQIKDVKIFNLIRKNNITEVK